MPGFSSLNVAITGMRAAQKGLAVTGHNMANAEISGFSRQRSIQSEMSTRRLGVNAAGNLLKVGTGVDNNAVHHIRSAYFDMLYRTHNARLHFYSVKASIGEHVEEILGETENSFRMQNLLSDMFNSFHELNVSLGGIYARDAFVGTAISFLDKAQNIFNELHELQLNLDAQIRAMVLEINGIVAQIDHLNREIQRNEFAGDNANDLRDERHRLMDRLSGLVPVTFHEDWETSRIDITTIGGNWFLSQGAINPLGLKHISGRYDLVEPVFTHSPGILPSNTPPSRYQPFFSWHVPIDAAQGNDRGALMALLQLRGAMPLTYRGAEGLWNPARPDARPPVPEPFDEIWFAGLLPDLADLPGNWGDFQTDFEAYIDEWNDFFTTSAAHPGGLPFFHPDFPGQFPYTGPIPPNPADFEIEIEYDNPDTWPAWWTPPVGFGPGDTYTTSGFENPAFEGAWRRYLLERENDRNQFQRLFPLSAIRDGVDFNAAVAAGIADPTDPAFRNLMGAYNAARRTYHQVEWSERNALIPRLMMQMDQVVNAVVRLVNDSMSPIGYDQLGCPDAPYDFNRRQSRVEVFIRQHHDRFIEGGDFDGVHNPGMRGVTESLYTTRNIMINPELLLPGGYNLLALSLDGRREDTRVIQEMIRQWNLPDGDFSITHRGHTFSIEDAYRSFIVDLGIEVNEAATFLGSEFQQVMQADYRRNAIAGVSQDEELSSMMTFQFAYQAAARLFNIIDSMIDTVVNRTGRVGL